MISICKENDFRVQILNWNQTNENELKSFLSTNPIDSEQFDPQSSVLMNDGY